MVGELGEIDYPSLKQQRESSQRQLYSYTGDEPTYIAVVSRPRNTGITDICDEWMPSLGMPERHLDRFFAYRSGFKSNSAVDDPMQRAYDEARLDYHYNRHVRTSDEAQKALSAIVSRLESGEDVCLVCFEERPEPCHRYELKSIIEARLQSKYTFRAEQLTV